MSNWKKLKRKSIQYVDQVVPLIESIVEQQDVPQMPINVGFEELAVVVTLPSGNEEGLVELPVVELVNTLSDGISFVFWSQPNTGVIEIQYVVDEVASVLPLNRLSVLCSGGAVTYQENLITVGLFINSGTTNVNIRLFPESSRDPIPIGTTTPLMIVPELQPVNALSSSLSMEIKAVPDTYVAVKQASAKITVASIPNVNVQATGTITVGNSSYTAATGTVIIDSNTMSDPNEFFVIGGETFTYKAEPSLPFEIGAIADYIAAANATMAAINLYSTKVTASNLTVTENNATFTITAKISGVEGNSIGVYSYATALSFGWSTLRNGVTEELHPNQEEINASAILTVSGNPEIGQTLLIGSKEFTFVASRTGDGEITRSESPQTLAQNIASAINSDAVGIGATANNNTVIITSEAPGATGNGVPIEENAFGVSFNSEYLFGGQNAVENTLTVFDQEFSFVETRSGVGEIVVGANKEATAQNIAFAINEDVEEVTATVNGAVVTIEAVTDGETYVGDGGNVIVLTESAACITVSGSGTLDGGVNGDTISIDSNTYRFVDSESPSALEIQIGIDAAATAANIVEFINIPTISLLADDDEITITATASGTLGNLIPIVTDGTRITRSGAVTSGGTDEVISYIEVNGKEYVFALEGGDDSLEEYPNMIPVALGAEDTVADVAEVLAATIAAEDNEVTAVADSDALTVTCKIKGSVGNSMSYANHLVTAGDILDDSVEGTFTGGVDGTPGTKGQISFYGTSLYLSIKDDPSNSNDGWIEFVKT